MALKGSKITHWPRREQKMLFVLRKKRKLTWEQIAARISRGGTKRTAAACSQFFKVRLQHLKKFPKGGVVRLTTPMRIVSMHTPVQTTVKFEAYPPGPVLVIIDGHVTKIEKTSRTPADLLTFLLTEKKTKKGARLAAGRTEENEHGTASIGEPSAEHP
jgi:hypothetical protein